MGIATLMRYAIVGAGLILAAASVWFYAVRKMTPDLAVAWCLLGAAMTGVGVIPGLSGWLGLLPPWADAVLLCVGGACLLGAFRTCLLLSRLITQNQELAMMVSLLMAEDREEGAESAERRLIDEESAVCH